MDEGGSEIGIVISIFFVFILILLPLNLFIQELNYYNHINQKVRMATEIACFDTLLTLDSDALSQVILQMNQDVIDPFKAEVIEALPIWFEPINFKVGLINNRQPNYLNVYFEYPYVTQYFLAGHLEKTVIVKLNFELPIDN